MPITTITMHNEFLINEPTFVVDLFEVVVDVAGAFEVDGVDGVVRGEGGGVVEAVVGAGVGVVIVLLDPSITG